MNDLAKMTRAELEEEAHEFGILGPESYPSDDLLREVLAGYRRVASDAKGTMKS